MNQSKRIDYLFRLYLNGELSPVEWEELRILVADIKADDTETLRTPLSGLWEQARRGELPSQAHTLNREQLYQRIIHDKGEKKKIIRIASWRNIAAVAAIAGLIFTAGWQYYAQPLPQRSNPSPEEIHPASAKAILTLSDGSQIILDSTATGKIAQQGAATITNVNAQLRYQTGIAGTQTTSYNTVTTARAGQYQLILPDGSHVWLNALSSIRFPTSFAGSERIVDITGEVYFEVTKDKSKPFIVRTNRDKVMVLGTSFNVKDYTGEPVKISLLEGAVKVNGSTLKPGEAYQNGHITTTDLLRDLAWKNGLFDFQDKKLEEVMRELSRWYDIEIVYEKSVPDIEFGGKLGRDLNLEEVLRALQHSGVNFSWKGNRRLVVRP